MDLTLTKPVVAEQAGLEGYESSQPAESLSANPCRVYELNHHLTLLLPGTLYLVHCPYITSQTSPRDDILRLNVRWMRFQSLSYAILYCGAIPPPAYLHPYLQRSLRRAATARK